jgi:DNA-binding IclR family transcriptional regulator
MKPADAETITRANAARLALQQRSVADVLRLVRTAREAGYAYAPQGLMRGTAAIAVPVCDASGQVVAAISIAALADRLDRKRLAAVLARMREQASLIERRREEVHAARARVGRPETTPNKRGRKGETKNAKSGGAA